MKDQETNSLHAHEGNGALQSLCTLPNHIMDVTSLDKPAFLRHHSQDKPKGPFTLNVYGVMRQRAFCSL